MKNKELFQQLNKLKEIKADLGKKELNKELLINQIYSGKDEKAQNFGLRKFFFYSFSYQLKSITMQPVMSVFLICFFALTGGFFSIKMSEDTKPGDSLYIAKVLNEKRQKVLTFDEKEKAHLGIKLAKNRAEEINMVLEENKENKKKNEEKVDKLVSDFKKEINDAKENLEKMKKVAIQENPEKISEDLKNKNDEDNNSVLFTAKSNKNSQGMEVFDPHAILSEATDLLDNNNYAATIDKLIEADNAILKITEDVDSLENCDIEKSQNASSTIDILDLNNATSSPEENNKINDTLENEENEKDNQNDILFDNTEKKASSSDEINKF